jgi:hypothetical protein
MSDLQAQLQQAVALIRDGRTEEARPLLQQVVTVDPSQEPAWLWLATIAANNEERLYYLEQALALNPNNPTTQAAYTQIVGKPYAVAPTAPGALKPAGPVSFNMVFIVMAVMFIATILIVVAVIRQRDNNSDDDNKPLPTMAPPDYLLTTETATATMIIYTPTITNTPFPSDTPGPSPTPVRGLPTWTAAPPPTATDTPTRVPPSPTRTETSTDEPTLTPTVTSTFTTTPTTRGNTRTQTAEAGLAQQSTLTETPAP